MKKGFRHFIELLIILIAYAAVIAAGIFFKILPALVLGHMLKG